MSRFYKWTRHFIVYLGMSTAYLQTMTSASVQAQESKNSLSNLLQSRLFLKVDSLNSTQVLVTEELRKLYQFTGMNPLWVSGSQTNSAAAALKNLLLSADQYGLKPANYWNAVLQNLSTKMTDRNAITFELLLSDAYLRFSRDLINGQVVDPDLIDEDIKMTRKPFEYYAILAESARNGSDIKARLESLAPQNPNYKRLKLAMQKLKDSSDKEPWEQLVDPGVDLKPGASHPTIPEIKKRLNHLGYGLENNRTVIFDADSQVAIKKYQELNQLPSNKNISRSFYSSLQPEISERLDRMRANLEKFRWFPNKWEDRHLYVNLAFQELSIFEAESTVVKMRTVVGRPTRRTPTLRDQIRFVELNPTWTVPLSIAIKDKLPQLQKNPMALDSQNIWVYDQGGTSLDPSSIEWSTYSKTNFPFTLVQQPGSHNSLGLVKFPLTNPWFIYLHDTNEPHLMREVNRLRSSGCVRLEKAFDLVQYLLKDQPEWTLSRIRSQTQAQFRIPLKRSLPVYFIYQTVDVTERGEIRMVPDLYGQDRRLNELFNSRGSNEKF